ncbi:type I-MYXAN CRISPR-associated protein Cas6/Cmx6 [Cyanobacterium sp. DS4]|uniref:type I-MYXAN CRISPR-associated protein Cas6/Cmx6 n=1 Tax=Cyanobacterium sp. DS4 TaxID=2878255 RepID=UPI002E813CD5|nr:type I-MYXAN CRISPR-associated protein Cas6/Cmx6 [Cyanobacterium sp. Dongsha4]
MSRLFPIIHDIDDLSILPIIGKPEFPQNLYLTPESQLCLRLFTDKVPLIYRLAGKTLNLNNDKIRLGLPESQELEGCGQRGCAFGIASMHDWLSLEVLMNLMALLKP